MAPRHNVYMWHSTSFTKYYRGGASAARGKRGPFKRDYTPVTWDKYFDAMKDLKVDDDNVYFFYGWMIGNWLRCVIVLIISHVPCLI